MRLIVCLLPLTCGDNHWEEWLAEKDGKLVIAYRHCNPAYNPPGPCTPWSCEGWRFRGPTKEELEQAVWELDGMIRWLKEELEHALSLSNREMREELEELVERL